MNEIPINSPEFSYPNDSQGENSRSRNQSMFRNMTDSIRENYSITGDQRNPGSSRDLVIPQGEVPTTEEWQKQTFEKWVGIIAAIKKNTNHLPKIKQLVAIRVNGARTKDAKQKWKKISEQIDIVMRDFTTNRAKLQAYLHIFGRLKASAAIGAVDFKKRNGEEMTVQGTTFDDLRNLCNSPIITNKREPTLSQEVWLSKLYSIDTNKLDAPFIDCMQSSMLQTSETQQKGRSLKAADIKKSIDETNINDIELVLLGIRSIIWRFDLTAGLGNDFCCHVQHALGSEAFDQLMDLELPETSDIEEQKRAVREQLFKANWRDQIEQIPPKVLGNLLLAITQEMDQTQDAEEKGKLANLREKAFRLGASKDATIGMGERLLCLYDILKFTYDKSCNLATQENLLGRWHKQAEAVLGKKSITMLVELYIPKLEMCENSDERMQDFYKKLFPESEGCSEPISRNKLSDYEQLKWLVFFINDQDINNLLGAIETMQSINDEIDEDEAQQLAPSQQENSQWIEYQYEDFWNDVRDICEKLQKSLKSKHIDYVMRGLQKIVNMLGSKEDDYFADCDQDPDHELNEELDTAISGISDFFECIRKNIEMLMGSPADVNYLKELKIPEKTYERIKNFDSHKLNEFISYIENLAKDDRTYADFLNDMKMIYRHNKYSNYLKMYKEDAIGALGCIILKLQKKWDTEGKVQTRLTVSPGPELGNQLGKRPQTGCPGMSDLADCQLGSGSIRTLPEEDYPTIELDEGLFPIYNYIKEILSPLGMKVLLSDIKQGNYGEDDSPNVAIEREPSIRDLSLTDEQSEEAKELSAVTAVFDLFHTDEIFKETAYRVIDAVINKDQEAICDKIIDNLSFIDQRVNGDLPSDEKALVQEIGNVIFGLDELKDDPALQSSMEEALQEFAEAVNFGAKNFGDLSDNHPLLDSSKNLDFLRNLHILVELGSEELNKKLAIVGNKESLRTVAGTLVSLYCQKEETIDIGNLLHAKVCNLQTVNLAEKGTSIIHLDKLRYVIREVRCYYDSLQHDGTNEPFKKQAEDFFEDITNIMGKDIAGQMGIDLKTREKLNILDTVKHYLPDDLLSKHIDNLQNALKDYINIDEYGDEKSLLEYLSTMYAYQKYNQSFSDDLILEAYNYCQSDYSRYIAHVYEGKEIINREELYREIPFPFVPESEGESSSEEDEGNEESIMISDGDNDMNVYEENEYEDNDMDIYEVNEQFQDNAKHQAIRHKVESISKEVIENLAEEYAVYRVGIETRVSDAMKNFLAFREDPLNTGHWEKVTVGFEYLQKCYQEGTYFTGKEELYNQLSSLFVPPSNETSRTLVDIGAWLSTNDYSSTGMTERLDAIDLEGSNNGEDQDYTKFTDYLKDEDNRKAIKDLCKNVLEESDNTNDAAISTRLKKILKIYNNGIQPEHQKDIARNFRLIKSELSNCSKPVQISLRLAGISVPSSTQENTSQTGKGRKNNSNDDKRGEKRLRTESKMINPREGNQS